MTPKKVMFGPVYGNMHTNSVHRDTKEILYNLLAERTPSQSISHKEMPSFEEHCEFIDSRPYLFWYLIINQNRKVVGSIYLTKQKEIGIHIFKQYRRRGYGKIAVTKFIKEYANSLSTELLTEFYANINPKNKASIALFKGLGFEHIQNTYKNTV